MDKTKGNYFISNRNFNLASSIEKEFGDGNVLLSRKRKNYAYEMGQPIPVEDIRVMKADKKMAGSIRKAVYFNWITPVEKSAYDRAEKKWNSLQERRRKQQEGELQNEEAKAKVRGVARQLATELIEAVK